MVVVVVLLAEGVVWGVRWRGGGGCGARGRAGMGLGLALKGEDEEEEEEEEGGGANVMGVVEVGGGVSRACGEPAGVVDSIAWGLTGVLVHLVGRARLVRLEIALDFRRASICQRARRSAMSVALVIRGKSGCRGAAEASHVSDRVGWSGSLPDVAGGLERGRGDLRFEDSCFGADTVGLEAGLGGSCFAVFATGAFALVEFPEGV